MWQLRDALGKCQWDGGSQQDLWRLLGVISHWSVSGRKRYDSAAKVARAMRGQNLTWDQVYAAFLLGGLSAAVGMLPWEAGK